ncbi:MAG TPA: alpha/beta hydrolase [Candidatus Saccharimonadales bacterium]|nr:alpha/beta hydrolase [Candidatus Saccharimonadales bacterium]
MRNAVIIHGRPDKDEYYSPNMPSLSNMHWLPWLQRQLQLKNIIAQTPEIPMSFRPDYKIWKKELERFDITSETILVGHSCGGGFLVRWLTENKDVKVGKVVLVAPWINPDDNPASETGDFFHFELDPTIASRTKGLIIFLSDNDNQRGVKETVHILKDKVDKIAIKNFQNYGHFLLEDMGTEKFPELLEECLAENL